MVNSLTDSKINNRNKNKKKGDGAFASAVLYTRHYAPNVTGPPHYKPQTAVQLSETRKPYCWVLPNSVMRRARRHSKTRTHPPLPRVPSQVQKVGRGTLSLHRRVGLECIALAALPVECQPFAPSVATAVVVGPRSVQSSLGRVDVTVEECACAGGVERFECVGSNGSAGPRPPRTDHVSSTTEGM